MSVLSLFYDNNTELFNFKVHKNIDSTSSMSREHTVLLLLFPYSRFRYFYNIFTDT